MAEIIIETQNVMTYRNGQFDRTGGMSIGRSSTGNTGAWVGVIEFVAPESGATEVTITVTNITTRLAADNTLINLSDTLEGSEFLQFVTTGTQGTVTNRGGSGGTNNHDITVTLEANLMPGETYYIFFSPVAAKWTTVGYRCSTNSDSTYTMNASGCYGGLLTVWDENGDEHKCIPYVWSDEWRQCLAFAGDGTNWRMGV